MCGINGFNFLDKKIILNMNKEISHRGPDGSKIYLSKNLSLGHLRLSIIDLSELGSQPMKYIYKSKTYIIVFNGEIYNYKEVKEELLKEGFKFKSESDTEVILAAYCMWGEKCVEKFNGMWAFCLYDVLKQILFLSRDRMGVKPLYYYNKGNKFIFSSELKGILAHKSLKISTSSNISKEGVDLFFSMECIPAPYTIFNNVYKLEARQNLIYDLKKSKIAKKEYYYDLPNYVPKKDKKYLISKGNDLLDNSTKLRMRSDVEVGAFVSGGIDSTCVLSTMKKFTDMNKINTFSIGFKESFDETPYIKLVNEKIKTKNHHKYFEKKDFENILKIYSKIYDEPFADVSGFPTFFVCNLAKMDKIKVVLSGDGGDEVFGGYNNYKIAAKLSYLKLLPKPIRKLLIKTPRINKQIIEGLKLSLLNTNEFYSEVAKDRRIRTKTFKKWSKEKLELLLKKSNGDIVEAFRIYDVLYNTLPDKYLTKVDRASMANGVEVRSPFLDYRFYEFSQEIPRYLKVDFKNTKKFVPEIFRDRLFKEVYSRKKRGFSFFIDDWLLTNKVLTDIKDKLELLNKKKVISNDIYLFYKNQVFNSKSYKEYNYPLIYLVIFCNWYDTWISN